MSLVLTGITAFEFWHSAIPHLSPEFGVISKQSFLTLISHISAKEASNSLKEINGFAGDIHVLVDASYNRRAIEDVSFHCCMHPELLPEGSIYQLGRDLYVVSPELCYVQLAATLPFLETLRVGTDLCSRYQLSLFEKKDLPECEPVTTKAKIESYIARLPKGTPGAKQAKLAAQWIIEGTRSPRETSLCMLMALPTRRGGFQMPAFEANYEIEVKGKAKKVTKKMYLEADVYFLKTKRIFEYQSDDCHDDSLQIGFDFEKIGALQILKYVVTPITTWQMSNYDALEALLVETKKQMGSSDRNGEKYSSLRRHVHYEVLDKERRDREAPVLWETARWRFLLTKI